MTTVDNTLWQQLWWTPYEIWTEPKSSAPKAIHLLPVVTERSVAVDGIAQIYVKQLLNVGPDRLVGVNERNLLYAHGKQHVQE